MATMSQEIVDGLLQKSRQTIDASEEFVAGVRREEDELAWRGSQVSRLGDTLPDLIPHLVPDARLERRPVFGHFGNGVDALGEKRPELVQICRLRQATRHPHYRYGFVVTTRETIVFRSFFSRLPLR